MDNPRHEELGKILAGMADQNGWQRAQWVSVIAVLWRRVVGNTVADHTQIVTLTTEGVLVVAVPSSVWSQELQYYKPTILDAIRLHLPESRIRDIRTRVRTTPQLTDLAADLSASSPYYASSVVAEPKTDNLHELLQVVQEKYEQAAREWMVQGFHACASCHAPILQRYTLCIACEAYNPRKGRQ